jgi:outer membrane protein
MKVPPPRCTPRRRASFLIARTAPALALALAAGCASPLRENPEDELRHSIMQSARRELHASEVYRNQVTLSRDQRAERSAVDPERIPELDNMAGPKSYVDFAVPLGQSLLGTERRTVAVSLERVVKRVVDGNLNVQFARLAPAISEAQLVAAQAAFDWVFFTNFQWDSTDQPRTGSAIGGTAVGVTADQRQVTEIVSGLRKRLTSGGQFTAQNTFRVTDVETRNLATRPDPAHEANIRLLLEQPLLRNFGSDVALAQVRLAQNQERDEIQALKGTLITNITDAEEAYWVLVRNYATLKIVKRLYDRGESVRADLKARLDVDVEPAAYADAVARVESRRAQIIRAQNALAAASDQLKLLMNDPELPIGSDLLLLPADDAIDESITFNLRESLETAFTNRPEVQRALLSIDNTSIRQVVANNQLLPRLDLRALTQFNSIGGSANSAYQELPTSDFVDYGIGLSFELPIGNREAQAGVLQRRLERSQAVIAYRNTIQGIVSEVNNALRNVQTNFELIDQTRAARLAATENVRTLDVKLATTQGKTPEFLNVQLNRQEQLSQAEIEELQSLVDYNVAIARLFSSMGTTLERNRIEFQVPDVEPIKESHALFPVWDTGLGPITPPPPPPVPTTFAPAPAAGPESAPVKPAPSAPAPAAEIVPEQPPEKKDEPAGE